MAFKAKGLITPVVTALTAAEEFNKSEYQSFINHLIEAGVHGIFPLGTNGEFYAFTAKEKMETEDAWRLHNSVLSDGHFSIFNMVCASRKLF